MTRSSSLRASYGFQYAVALRRFFPRAAADLVADAANDAILTYAVRPHTFDVSRQVPLDHFLVGIAARILRDRLRSDKRRFVREGAYAEHVLQAQRYHSEDCTTSRAAVREIRGALPSVCNATELVAIVAWLNEDDTGVVAVRLGMSHLRPMEQRREVKRFTARVINRLRRHFQGRQTTNLVAVQKNELLGLQFVVWRQIHLTKAQ